jgi:hypothetical protein
MAMANDRNARPPEKPDRDREDLLSPNRALRESLGSSASQRVGDSGPLANPIVTFPGELEDPGPD